MLKYMKLGNKSTFWIGNDSHIWPLKWPNKITVSGISNSLSPTFYLVCVCKNNLKLAVKSVSLPTGQIFKKFFYEYLQSVKQYGCRSEPDVDPSCLPR